MGVKKCKHKYVEHGIGAELVRRVCVHCGIIRIGERPPIGIDPWGSKDRLPDETPVSVG
jgi:hypothetical protein